MELAFVASFEGEPAWQAGDVRKNRRKACGPFCFWPHIATKAPKEAQKHVHFKAGQVPTVEF